MDCDGQLSLLSRTGAVTPFEEKLAQYGLTPLCATSINILQMNITRRCTLSCRHCHVDAGPHRTEEMARETMEKCLDIAARSEVTTVDVTGGSPETHPHLAWFLDRASQLKKRLIVRSNLVVLLEKEYSCFIEIYGRNRVEVVGSLPDFRRERTDRQRGTDVFEKSIEALRRLNAAGYGRENTGLTLDLVHNPAGAFIPGPQKALEAEYKKQLSANYGVTFNSLFSLTNCPTGRFLDYLVGSDNLDDYLRELLGAFNPSAARNVMCRTTLSVGWDGTLYDCDFNQMLDLSVNHGAPDTIEKFNFKELVNRQIVVANHCYCCTAGAGSSCQGASIAG